MAWILLLSPVYLIKYFFRNFIFNPNSLLTKILTPLLDIKYKYIVICYYLFLGLILIITTLIWLYIGSLYNKNYTMRLLKKGYSPLENDDYALALLKGYGYLEYTEEEKEDKEKIRIFAGSSSKELAKKIEKETLNDCEVKYEGKEDERIEIWTKTYECFSYTSKKGLIFEMQDGYLTEEEIEYLFNEYKKIKEVIQNFLEQKEK
nr:MAG TPA: hypothetical protein [Caudoviricetes sp.]